MACLRAVVFAALAVLFAASSAFFAFYTMGLADLSLRFARLANGASQRATSQPRQ
jgi:hypothetical protein